MTQRSMPRVRSWQARGAGQFLETEPGAVHRAHAQQDLEARIGRCRTQGQNGLRQQLEGIGRERARSTCAAKLETGATAPLNFARCRRTPRRDCGRVPWPFGRRVPRPPSHGRGVDRGRRGARRRCSRRRARACRRGRRSSGWPRRAVLRRSGRPARCRSPVETWRIGRRRPARPECPRDRAATTVGDALNDLIADMHAVIFVDHIQLIDVDIQQARACSASVLGRPVSPRSGR